MFSFGYIFGIVNVVSATEYFALFSPNYGYLIAALMAWRWEFSPIYGSLVGAV